MPWLRATRRDGGAKPAFAAVAEAHLDDVYRYLLYVTKDAAVAEDLASETFERALRGWSGFEPGRASALTWLCRIARNVALDHFRSEERRRAREERYASGLDDARAAPSFGETFSPGLADALLALSAADREVLALRVILELDADGAARVLGISRTACTTRLSRALKRLEEKVRADVAA